MVSLIASGRSKSGWRRWPWWWFRNTLPVPVTIVSSLRWVCGLIIVILAGKTREIVGVEAFDEDEIEWFLSSALCMFRLDVLFGVILVSMWERLLLFLLLTVTWCRAYMCSGINLGMLWFVARWRVLPFW